MLERIVEITSRYNMFGPEPRDGEDRRVGVAVSGGVDSVVLLHALWELRERLRLNLEVVHVNHRMRGSDSDGDQEFAAALARRLAVPFRAIALGPLSGNFEEAAREARLAFFHSLVRDGGLRCVATGHTASDQAETVLFRFLRGSGGTGLSGIRPVTREGLVRPLLEVTRAEVEAFAAGRGIEWRVDASNAALAYARNRIRHQLLPQLQRDYNPALAAQLAHVADISREEDAFWEEHLAPIAARVLRPWRASVLLDCRGLSALPVAVQRRLLRMACARAKGNIRQIGFDHIERARRMANSRGGSGRMQAPGLAIERSFEWMRLSAFAPLPPPSGPVPLNLPGITRLPGGDAVLLDQLAAPGPSQESSYNEDGNEVLLAAPDQSRCPLVLRYWQPGDCYRPVGRARPEKVKLMFQEARIPLWERRFWPIIENSAGILWARRFGVSESAAGECPKPGVSCVYRLREIFVAGKESSGTLFTSD